MDNASWGALALALSVLIGIWTWHAVRQRRWAAGVRGAAVTLVPIAAYLTHTLRMVGRMVDVIGDWAAGFVFSPTVWLGLIIAGVAVVLFLVSFRLPGGSRPKAVDGSREKRSTTRRQPAAKDIGKDIGLDDDMDDIQAILRKHGIS